MASKLTPAQRVALARHPERPGTADFIKHLFTDFFEQRGDRLCAEDGSILGGVALFHGKPVTVIGHRKGRSLEENLSLHFGMPSPEGYRKAQRLMLQAEKFRRPVITFIDTPGAYPGLEAERLVLSLPYLFRLPEAVFRFQSECNFYHRSFLLPDQNNFFLHNQMDMH